MVRVRSELEYILEESMDIQRDYGEALTSSSMETQAGSWRLETGLETGVESRLESETERDWSDCGEAQVQAEPGESPRGSNVV